MASVAQKLSLVLLAWAYFSWPLVCVCLARPLRHRANYWDQQRKQLSIYWFNKSSDLRGAAAAVWVSMDADVGKLVVERAQLGEGFSVNAAVYPVYAMLCGMALELIFKAITVQRGGKINQSTHDLSEHLNPTGIKYAPKQVQLLRILSHSITWNGRYPVPKKEGAMDDFQKLVRTNLCERVAITSSGKFTALRANGALDWESFSEIWGKACSLYFQLNRDEPDDPGRAMI